MQEGKSLSEMAEYIAKKFGITQADVIYDSVEYFYRKVRKEDGNEQDDG